MMVKPSPLNVKMSSTKKKVHAKRESYVNSLHTTTECGDFQRGSTIKGFTSPPPNKGSGNHLSNIEHLKKQIMSTLTDQRLRLLLEADIHRKERMHQHHSAFKNAVTRK